MAFTPRLVRGFPFMLAVEVAARCKHFIKPVSALEDNRGLLTPPTPLADQCSFTTPRHRASELGKTRAISSHLSL